MELYYQAGAQIKIARPKLYVIILQALSLNKRHGFSGHVWQGRFFSCPLDEAHLWAAIRYVELNPVRAGMVARAEDYKWSSAPAHCGLEHLTFDRVPPSAPTARTMTAQSGAGTPAQGWVAVARNF